MLKKFTFVRKHVILAHRVVYVTSAKAHARLNHENKAQAIAKVACISFSHAGSKICHFGGAV